MASTNKIKVRGSKKFTFIALFGTIILLTIGLLFSAQPAESQVYNETQTYANVTVNVVIDVSLTGIPIDFGSLDPGVSDQNSLAGGGSGGWPTNVTVYATTNTAWNLSIKASGDFIGPGVATIPIGNLEYGNVSTLVETPMTTTYASPFADWVNQSDPSVDEIRSIYFDITIPSGQTAGSYSTQVYINVTEYV
jgi:hypothetical protein